MKQTALLLFILVPLSSVVFYVHLSATTVITVRFYPGTNQSAPEQSRIYNMNNLGWVYANSTNWAVFNAYPTPERPTGGSPAITYMTTGPVGSPTVDSPIDTVSGVNWVGGTTNGTVTGQKIVARVAGKGNGFRMVVPLGNNSVVKRVVFVGGAYQSDTVLKVSYSDGSAMAVVRQDVIPMYHTYTEAYYSIDAQAGSDNASLIIEWTGNGNYNANLGPDWITPRFIVVAPIPPEDKNLTWYAPHTGPPVEVPEGTAGTTVTSVPAGADLQGAINSAQPGDVLSLEDGTWQGNYVLPAKLEVPGRNITIRAATWTVPNGQRAIPSDFHVKIQTLNTLPCLSNDASNPSLPARRANNWRVEGIECLMTGDQAGAKLVYYGIFIGVEGNAPDGDLSFVPEGFEFEHIWIHGDEIATNLQHGFYADAKNVRVADSIIDNIRFQGAEATGISYLSGIGPYTFVNNYIEAAGENFLAQGEGTPHPWAKAHDIVLRQNYSQKRLSWFSPGGPITSKNNFEFKMGQNILEEGNVTEFGWSANQIATGYMLTPRTSCQGLGGTGAYWSGISNVTIQNNTVRNYPIMGLIGLYDDKGASCFLPEQLQFTHDVTFQNNRAVNMSSRRWSYGGLNNEIQSAGYVMVTVPDHLKILNNTTAFLEGATGNPDKHWGIFQNQHWSSDQDIENNIFGSRIVGDGGGPTSTIPVGLLARFINNSQQYAYPGDYSGSAGAFPQIGNVWSHALNLANVKDNTIGIPPQDGIGANDLQLDALENLARYGNRTYPDFTIAVSPPAIQHTLTTTAALAVTINQVAVNGFTGVVNYTVHNLPTGVSAVFRPTTVIGSGVTTLILTHVGGSSVGFQPVLVMAFCGPYLYHQDAITLNVTGP